MRAPCVEAFQIRDKKFINDSQLEDCKESYRAGYLRARFFYVDFRFYVNILVQDEGKDWPKSEKSGIAQLQIGVEDGDGDVEENAGEDHLDCRNNKTTMYDEVGQKC